MQMNIVLDDYALLPERAHSTDAGLDLKTPVDFKINPGASFTVNTGVHVQLPKNTVGMLKSKSGLNVRDSVVSEGVIDEGYTGAIRVKLYNHGYGVKKFFRGDKITQLVILPVVIPDGITVLASVDELEQTERGERGFGSTGR